MLLVDPKVKEEIRKEGKVRRWCETAELDARAHDGWTPVDGKEDPEHKRLSVDHQEDGSNVGSRITARELTLCERSKEVDDKYKEWQKNESTKALRTSVDMIQEARGEVEASLRKKGYSKREIQKFIDTGFRERR